MCFQASVSDYFDYIAYAKGDGKIKRQRNEEKPLRKNTHHNSCERRWLQANKRKINVNQRTIQLDSFESIQFDLICICIQTVVFLPFQFNSFITFFQFYSYSHDDRYNRCTYVLLCVWVCLCMYGTTMCVRKLNSKSNCKDPYQWLAEKYMKCNYVKPLNQRPNGKIHFLSLPLASAFDCFLDYCLFTKFWLCDWMMGACQPAINCGFINSLLQFRFLYACIDIFAGRLTQRWLYCATLYTKKFDREKSLKYFGEFSSKEWVIN